MFRARWNSGTRARRSVWILAVLAAGLLLPMVASGQNEIAGHWEGAIEIPGTPLGIMVDLVQDGASWNGTIDIPLQGAKGLALTGVAVEGGQVKFGIQGIQGDPAFDGKLSEGKITGTFTQMGQSFPFTLGREETAALKRPQEPKEPFPYKVEEISYANGDVTLAGTLTIPEGKGPFPAVLLISGSGPQDRNEEIFGHKPFLVLADHLTRAGIAVMRMDDRGVGGSTGDLMGTPTAELATDALAGVLFLAKRPEIDDKKIGLIGHSEGGLIAPLVAKRTPHVKFLVLMAAPGVRGDEILRRQTERIYGAMGATEAQTKAILEEHGKALHMIRSGADSTALAEQARKLIRAQFAVQAGGQAIPDSVVDQQAVAAVRQMTSPWFRAFLDLDPRDTLRITRIPVFALSGGLDLQVEPDQNLPEIEAALKEAANPNVTIRRFPKLNHLFQTAQTGLVQEYATIEETINPDALAAITEWIRGGLAGKWTEVEGD